LDIKLKNYRGTAWGISSIFAVISAAVTSLSISVLAILYEIRYMSYSVPPDPGEGLAEVWKTEEVPQVEPVISKWWMVLVAALLIALCCIIISFVVTGRKDEEEKIQLTWFDRIFTEVQIGALCFIAFLIAMLFLIQVDAVTGTEWYRTNVLSLLSEKQMDIYNKLGNFYRSEFQPFWLEVLFTAAAELFLMGSFLFLCQSLVKKLKARSFWKYTILGRLCCYIYEESKQSEAIFGKVMVVTVGGAIVSATWFGLIPIFILIFVFVPKWCRKYTAVREGVRQIKEGDLNYVIPVDDDGELDRFAMDVNEIARSMNIAVQNELKNQRMKTDLISNVSHDLRTPLTSMVSYVDLLKKEGLDSENAPLYLEIIDEKTRRLRKLTEDLFEAAKASSGNIPVEITRIEMSSIVNQAIAETEERLSANDLNVIYTNQAESVFVMADGQLLWRVIENLLTNVGKYALPGSRVYLDIREDEEMIYLDVKNMSREQLNISADELMERFKRGDESRNTEGSGLGLSIAKDLTTLMNGQFSITIDGDLFKATVALRKSMR